MNPPPSLSSSSTGTGGGDAGSGMFFPQQTPNTIPCPICGTPILPNRANQCVRCLSARADITAGLPRHLNLIYCPDCHSYLQPPKTLLRADLESKELLAICLHRLKKPLSKNLKLVHAEFVWTEPHSKRIKLKIRIQGEIDRNAVVEQTHLVEFVIVDHLCDSCSRAAANPDQWVAKAQLRQHVDHRRTFFYLEQLILRHRQADKAIRIQETDDGIDFMFRSRSHAQKFVSFVSAAVPVASRDDKSLVSQDSKNNSYIYRYTFSVDICPVCREDLVCLPPPVARSLGIKPILICVKVTDRLSLLELDTLRVVHINANEYWRAPFVSLMVSRQLVEYVVIDVEMGMKEVDADGSKYCLADVHVARVSDFGRNDNVFIVKTHLGHLLALGDYALGYDMHTANYNNSQAEKYPEKVIQGAIQDVFLIKKSYEEKRQKRKGKQRPWKLKSLGMEVNDAAITTGRGRADKGNRSDEYEKFLRDLEENPKLRFDISLYRNEDYQPSEMTSTVGDDDDDDAPTVPLDELLKELELSDKEGSDDESDADSMVG